jgi:hypothetical protein
MRNYRFLPIAIILVFICVQIFLIADKFSGTRIIEVQKRDYRNVVTFSKSFRIKGTVVEDYNLKVQPKDFWDSMLLTNEDGNLLSILFKIAVSLSLIWYFFNLNYDNVFSKRSLNIVWMTLLLIGCTVLARYFGRSHTKDFWDNLSTSNGVSQEMRYMFDVPKYNVTFFNFFIPLMILFNLYRYFVDHQAGKSDDIW